MQEEWSVVNGGGAMDVVRSLLVVVGGGLFLSSLSHECARYFELCIVVSQTCCNTP